MKKVFSSNPDIYKNAYMNWRTDKYQPIHNLNILAEEGKIKKVFSEDKAVYETIKKTHYHFECQLCHKIIDIDPSLINIKINHSITGVTKKDLFLYGICDECKNKENNYLRRKTKWN